MLFFLWYFGIGLVVCALGALRLYRLWGTRGHVFFCLIVFPVWPLALDLMFLSDGPTTRGES